MTKDILDLMEERRQQKVKNDNKYKELDDMVTKKCLDAKESWFNSRCDKLEKQRHTSPKEMHRIIKEVCGKKGCTSAGCIKSKDGDIIVEKDQFIKRWTEYISELFDDERGEMPTIKREIDGPEILQSEVQSVVHNMKNNTSIGPDELGVELIKNLDELGIVKLTEVLNEIYNSGEIPPELSKSIFIALPKKSGAILCELHRTISIMSHAVKILLKVLMEDCGTRNAIFMLKLLCERAIEMKQDLYNVFY
ncbi:uncharacterized protein [Amphiura filiformis]|uniref:uncharacterized protein n=1 Tax=Amphiura filiformis TaxID=82378 RepID=UPI003B21CB22